MPNVQTNRTLGIAAALVACPAVAWLVACLAHYATLGRHGDYIALGALTVLPAALAAWFNAKLGRDRRGVVVAATLAVCVSLLGLGAFIVYFFLTVPEGFFT